MKAALLLLALHLLAVAPAALGHGFMFEPNSRNYLHDSDYCPHCLSAGGPYEVSAGSTLVWPAGVHGQCGDKLSERKHEPGGVYGPVGTVATYAPGSVITISLLITAQHGGRHAFRLCDRADGDEACFAAHLLQRADGAGPYTWVRNEGGPAIPSVGYSQGSMLGQSGEVYTMQYKLPDGVSCASCTLQWWWTTSNSCDVPGQPYGPSGMMPCDSPGPYPEEFWNCADIAITGEGSSSATPAPVAPAQPTPSPADSAPEQPVSEQPAPSTDAVPSSDTGGAEYSSKLNPGTSCDAACICNTNGDGIFPAPWSCAEFVICGSGTGATLRCPDTTLFDVTVSACNTAVLVDCGGLPN